MDIQDKIEKQITLKAPVSRVWQAITQATEFGEWFGVKLDGDFAAGQTVTGTFEELDPSAHAAIAQAQKDLGLEPLAIKAPAPHAVFCTVERIEPEAYFSFRWIPYGIDAEIDPGHEPTTLVEFQLTEVPEGTLLAITESGFSQVPAHRRARAFLMNSDGWAQQVQRIKEYVER